MQQKIMVGGSRIGSSGEGQPIMNIGEFPQSTISRGSTSGTIGINVNSNQGVDPLNGGQSTQSLKLDL